MADSLAITAAAPTPSVPPSTRGTAGSSDGGSSDFAQVLHNARDGQGDSIKAAHATVAADVRSAFAPAEPEMQAAAEPHDATQIVGFVLSSLAPTGDLATADNAVVAPSASANVEPTDSSTQDAARVCTQLTASLPVAMAATPSSCVITAATTGSVEKVEAAKHQQKKHLDHVGEEEVLSPPSQVSAATDIAVLPASSSPNPTVGEANGGVAITHDSMRVSASGTPPNLNEINPVVEEDQHQPASQQTGQPALPQRTGNSASPETAALPPQQSRQPVPTSNTALASSQPVSSEAGPPKASPSTHPAKGASSSSGSGSQDSTFAAAVSTLADKAVSVPTAPAASPLPIAAALPQHPAAEATFLSGAQPLAPHLASHTAQSPAAIGSDLRTNGSLFQSPAGEAATRSSAIEVGFHDANLGWLSVRATTDVTGSLHAAVAAKTPAALAAVDTMLPALGRFLQQENVAVHSVSSASAAAVPATSASVSTSHAASSGSGGSTAHQQGSGRDASQRNQHQNATATTPAALSSTVTRPQSTGAAAPYTQAERLSTVSVRI